MSVGDDTVAAFGAAMPWLSSEQLNQLRSVSDSLEGQTAVVAAARLAKLVAEFAARRGSAWEREAAKTEKP